MKRIILIIAILFWCGSVIGQAVGPKANTLIIKDLTGDTLSVECLKALTSGPAGTITISTIIAVPEPPTSFSMQIAIPIDQVKQKSSQRRDLKARIKEIPHLKVKIVALTIIGTWMYAFQDDLQAWSRDNDKAAHLLLSYGLSKFFGWKFALGFMLSIEATQSDIFGTEGRYEDTIEDLFVDFCGIAISFKF